MKFASKILLTAVLSVFAVTAYSQAMKPTIMIVPGEVWCTTNGYTQTFDNQGIIETLPDYKKALQESMDLTVVLTKLSALIADRGFLTKDLAQVLASVDRAAAEEALLMSKTSGAQITESPFDKLVKQANADIIIKVNWTTESIGPKNRVKYSLAAVDSYTTKQISASNGMGNPSMYADVSLLLEEAVIANMDPFLARLQVFFDDMMENGREIVISMRLFDNGSGVDFESDFDGVALIDGIEDWMAQNCVKGRYSASTITENTANFDQVRIPLYNEKNRAINARTFSNGLVNYLKAAPYNLTVKVISVGLGRVILVIGEK